MAWTWVQELTQRLAAPLQRLYRPYHGLVTGLDVDSARHGGVCAEPPEGHPGLGDAQWPHSPPERLGYVHGERERPEWHGGVSVRGGVAHRPVDGQAELLAHQHVTLETPTADDYLVAVEVLDQAQVAAGDWSLAQTTPGLARAAGGWVFRGTDLLNWLATWRERAPTI